MEKIEKLSFEEALIELEGIIKILEKGDCEIEKATNGIVTLKLTSQMSIVPGIMRDCEFHILDEEITKLKVEGLSIEIARCTDFESAIESTSEFTALTQVLNEG